jgi:hypothetical protein
MLSTTLSSIGGKMKKISLMMVISLGIFALMGCGNTAENANTGANKNVNTQANKIANTPATENKEPASPVFKPVEISPDAAKVNEFVDKVAANLNAWKGKEVTVTGYVSMASRKPSGDGYDGYNLMLINDEKSGPKKWVGCSVLKGALPEGTALKTVEVKGTVTEIQTAGDGKGVTIDPCTLKQ